MADWRGAVSDPAEVAMLTWTEKLTRSPGAMQREDLEALRAAGWEDTGIFRVAAIAAHFNYLNRMADALGVGR